MFIFFARSGKPLGTLNYKTESIHLLKSSKPDFPNKEEYEKIMNGDYIVRNNDRGGKS